METIKHLFFYCNLAGMESNVYSIPGMKNNIPEILRKRYEWIKKHSAKESSTGIALEINSNDRIGLISDIAAYVSSIDCSLIYVQSWVEFNGDVKTLIQIEGKADREEVIREAMQISSVREVIPRPTYLATWGKRVIVVGGGAQVAQVASGAIVEADRHNIRGETISVDTSAIIGEREIAAAVRAVGRLHRADMLVLAGAIMGGDITEAVKELRTHYGIPVISLRMAGSVNDVSDLVVSDPTEAGVMAVMLISHIGQFHLLEIHGNRY